MLTGGAGRGEGVAYRAWPQVARACAQGTDGCRWSCSAGGAGGLFCTEGQSLLGVKCRVQGQGSFKTVAGTLWLWVMAHP